MRRITIVIIMLCIVCNFSLAFAAENFDVVEIDGLDFYVHTYDGIKSDYKDVLKDDLLEMAATYSGNDSSFLLLNETDNINRLKDMLNDAKNLKTTNVVLGLKDEHYVLVVDYYEKNDGQIETLIVYDITTQFGKGATITKQGMGYTNKAKTYEYTLLDITSISAYQLEETTLKAIDLDDFRWRLIKNNEDNTVDIDGYTCNITMMIDFLKEDITCEEVLKVDDHYAHDFDMYNVTYDKIINDKDNIVAYYGYNVREVFLGFDERQLRRRVKQYKYEKDISPVMVYFDNKRFDDTCSFVLDYKEDGSGYKYIPRHNANKIEQNDGVYDEDDTYKYVSSMLAIDYTRDKSGELESLTVVSPYNTGGKGAVVDRYKTTYTSGEIDDNLTLDDIVGYCFLAE